MAASIGSFTGFTGWRGAMELSQRRTAKLPPKSGKKGRIIVLDAWEAPDAAVVTSEVVADLPAFTARATNYRKMQDGRSYPVTNPMGQSFTVKVLSVSPVPHQVGSQVRMITEWRFHIEASEP